MAGAVEDVELRRLRQAAGDQRVFDQVLDEIDVGNHIRGVIPLGDQFIHHVPGDVARDFLIGGAGGFQCLSDRDDDPLRIKFHNPAVALFHFFDG